MRQDPASMSDEALLAALGRPAAAPRAAPAAPRAAPVNPQAMSDDELMRALGRPAPAAPQRAPAGGGRQPARPAPAAPVPREPGEYGGTLTREDSVRAFMDQGYPADVALQKAIEQEQYDDAMTAAAAGPRADPASGAIEVEALPPAPGSGDVAGQILSRLPASVREAAMQDPVVGRALALNAGLQRGGARVGIGAYNLLGQGLDRLGLDGIGNAMQADAIARQNAMTEYNAPFREAYAGTNMTGQFLGEVAATAPAGGLVGRGISMAGQGVARIAPQTVRAGQILQRVGQSTAAGGFLPSAVRAPAAGAAPGIGERLGNLAIRGAGGAISGGAQAALINEDDAGAGAAIGALLPTVAARPAKYALNQLLNGFDALTGTLGRARASEIVRQSLGVDYDVAVAALRNAASDVTAQQALVEAGVEPSAFMGVGAAVRGANPDPFIALEARQAAARQAPIDRLAGGENLTAAQLSQRAEKEALRAATVPMGEAALARAGATGALDVDSIANQLMTRADAPGIRANPEQVQALANVAQQLRGMADLNGGVIDPADLYQIRQRYITNEVNRLLTTSGVTDPSALRARQAEITAEIAPLIDNAIEAAGGSGWRQYLADYASGMRGVERQQMMGVAAQQLRNNPNAFANLVEGNDPAAVARVFGGGNRIDLANQMNPTGVGPSGMDALTDAARQIRRDERVGVLAGEGRGVAQELLQQSSRSPVRRLVNLVARSRPGAAVAMDFGSMLIDAKVAPQVRRELAQAYQSGANMDELLSMVPTATRAQIARNMMNPAFWSHLTGAGANVMADPSSNAMSPAPQ